MSFPQSNSHSISLEEAAEMTARFRNLITPGSVIGGVFNADDILKILEQPECSGLRYYYGINGDSKPVLILVGVSADNKDLFDGLLMEMSWTCPDYCAPSNPLNSGS